MSALIRSNGINSALYDCSTGYTGSNNRLRVSEATSYYIEDKITLGNLILTIGHRSEEYDQVENRWNDGVPTRTQLASGYPKLKMGTIVQQGLVQLMMLMKIYSLLLVSMKVRAGVWNRS